MRILNVIVTVVEQHYELIQQKYRYIKDIKEIIVKETEKKQHMQSEIEKNSKGIETFKSQVIR